MSFTSLRTPSRSVAIAVAIISQLIAGPSAFGWSEMPGEVVALVRLIDVTGDGKPDKISLGSEGEVTVAIHTGGQTYETVRQTLPLVHVSNILSADLNRDGLTDLYLVSSTNNVALVGDGAGGFFDATEDLGLADGGWGVSAEQLDADDDGLPDLLLHNHAGDVLFWSRPNGGYDLAWKQSASGLSPSAQKLAEFLASASAAGSNAHDVFVLFSIQTVLDAYDFFYINDGLDEVDTNDILDGSLQGPDVSTSVGDVTHVGGNVGLGTSTPAAQLDVAGDVAINGAVVINAGGEWIGNPAGLQGPVGPTGPAGPAGADGADGAQGPTGLTGPAGAAGADGVDGAQGPMGLTGPAGAAGADGAQGPIGLTGPAGAAGADGADGAQGPTGLTGPAGADGADGAQGPVGLTGPAGAAGADGVDGAQGPIGLTGPAGAAGADGVDGAQGPMGLTGPAGADGSDGPQGPIGMTGPAGADGLDGAQGPAGADGMDGAQGPAGPAGVSFVRTALVAGDGSDAANGLALLSALSGITASAADPWVLKLEPGIYDLGGAQLVLQPFIDLEGSGETVTRIKGSRNLSGVVLGANDSQTRLLTIEGEGLGTPICFQAANTSPSLSQVTLFANATGSARGLQHSGNASVDLDRVTVDVRGPSTVFGIYGTPGSGLAAELRVHDSSVKVTNTGGGLASGILYSGTGRQVISDSRIESISSSASGVYGVRQFNVAATTEISNSLILSRLVGLSDNFGGTIRASNCLIDAPTELEQLGGGILSTFDCLDELGQAVGDNRGWSRTGAIVSLTDVGDTVGIGTGAPTFTLEVNGTAGKPGGGSWSNSSDRRLKKNIADMEGVLDRLLKLRGVTYEYIDPEAIRELPGTRLGMIAQEVEEVFPDWVHTADGYKRLTYRGFEALTVEALRELRQEKDDEIAELQEQLDALTRRLDSLPWAGDTP